ncbi:MAG TPA: M48 family metalloprotease [Nitrospirota bacterium]|nr:M48 family metalloprotease [Nitrospirota bacterium]
MPIAVPATMEVAGYEAAFTTSDASFRCPVMSLQVSPRIGKSDRFIALPAGGQFQCSDHELLDSLPQISPSEGPVAWLEDRWAIALLGILIIACLLCVGYFFGLPAAAERIAIRIPITTEQALGQQVLTVLDEYKWLKPTNLSTERQSSIRAGFDMLRSNLPFHDYYKLEFRASKSFGANAFAFPGGVIVITDDLVEFANSQEEVLAVLAHEIGHVELRHTVRSILQNSVVAVAAATVTSDAASLSTAVAGLPVMVAQTKYSRQFEASADEFAFKLLKQKNYSPAAFASLMERLAEKYKGDEHAYAYISTHPLTEERVRRAREESVSAVSNADITNIKASFEEAIRRDNNKAIPLISETIASGSLTPEKEAVAYNTRGILWMSEQGHVNAIADFDQAIKLNPLFSMAFFNRGIAYFQMRKFSLAASDLKKALQLNSDAYTAIWLYLAQANGGARDARSELAANIKNMKAEWPTPVVLLYLDKDSLDAAMTAISNSDSKAQNKQMCEANFYIAEWHLIKGEKERGLPLFSKVVSNCPKNYLEYAVARTELERLK